MRTAVSILRVSTKQQLTDGDGIENQRRGNNDYLRRKGYRLHREFVIAESASAEERADFGEVIDYLIAHKREIDVAVFWKMDRLSRAGVANYYALKAMLAKHGIRIEFATEQIDETPAGELMESILAASARFENRLRVDRTIGVERILTREGYWCRAAPTGFANGRAPNGKPILVPHPDTRQWDLLGYGLRKQLTGAYKIKEISDELRDAGLLTSRGTPMYDQIWNQICHNPIYGGLMCESWTEYELIRAKFDGPLSPQEWARLQQVLDGRNTVARRLPRRELNPDFPLRRFLRCPRCHEPVRGYAAVKRNKKRFPYYDCANKECHFRVSTVETHKLFVELLQSVTPTPELMEAFRHIVLSTWQEQCRKLSSQTSTLHQEVGRLRAEKRTLIELMKASAGNAALLAELQRDFERVTKQTTVTSMARNSSEAQEYEAEAVVNACLYCLEHASELWQKWPVDLQNKLQMLVLPGGVTYDVLKGQANPSFSLVYAAIANSAQMAPPTFRLTNELIQTMIEWYSFIKWLPLGQKAGCPS